MLQLPPVSSLRDRIGQMFMVGIEGESLGAGERLVLEEYAFGGVILFERNCRDPGRIVSLCSDLWDTAPDSPPFIAIDEEGGKVHRLPQPFTHFPPAARLGETRNTKFAYRAGRATAVELALAGINLNFAPVLDVASNPRNTVIADRAFARTPRWVTDMGTAWARGLGEGGIIACGKHFPGHSGTDADSHFELPVSGQPLEQLYANEVAPFAEACKQRIAALMTAHVLYPALDPALPATLSEKIVTGLLRHQFGYDGIVFSDDMAMNAIRRCCHHREAARLASRAGVDVLLFCHGLAEAIEALEFLLEQADREPDLRARLENSLGRIMDFKRRNLTGFTAVAAGALESELRRLEHRRIVEEIHGSL